MAWLQNLRGRRGAWPPTLCNELCTCLHETGQTGHEMTTQASTWVHVDPKKTCTLYLLFVLTGSNVQRAASPCAAEYHLLHYPLTSLTRRTESLRRTIITTRGSLAQRGCVFILLSLRQVRCPTFTREKKETRGKKAFRDLQLALWAGKQPINRRQCSAGSGDVRRASCCCSDQAARLLTALVSIDRTGFDHFAACALASLLGADHCSAPTTVLGARNHCHDRGLSR